MVKLGDKVRIITDLKHAVGSCLEVGDLGTVTEVSYDGTHRVDRDWETHH